MIRRRRTDDVARGGLTPQAVAVLLGGWAARSPGHPEDDDDGVWDLFLLDDRGLAALWEEHAGSLEQEAARLHVHREWHVGGHPCFYAESLAARLRVSG